MNGTLSERDRGWSCADWLPAALASPLSAPSTRPRPGPGLGPTRAATQAEGALWLELPADTVTSGGLQVATRLPVGGGVGGFARAVSVCGSSDRRLLLWQPAPSLNKLAELWLRLSCGFGFGWGLNRSAASAQTGNGAAAQMWQRLPSRHRTQCNDGLY